MMARLSADEEIEIPIFKELCTVNGDEASVTSDAMTGDWRWQVHPSQTKIRIRTENRY